MQNPKELLISEKITSKEFLEILLERDQSSHTHEQARANLIILEDVEVFNWFKNHEEFLFDYFYFLSFTNFHIAQIEACDNRNNEKAYQYLLSALNADNNSNGEDSEWTLHLKGTISYFESNTQELLKYFDQLPEGKKKATLGRLVEGLKKRGEPNYSEDY